jgi:hypothetical protein
MGIKHIWSILCKESLVNQYDNNLSINGVLEEISTNIVLKGKTSGLPDKFSLPMNYEVVSMWLIDGKSRPNSMVVEYTFIDPSNKELLKSTNTIEIPKTSRRHRTIMKISGMPLTTAGEYKMQIKMKEDKSNKFSIVAELPLEIKINLQKVNNQPVISN